MNRLLSRVAQGFRRAALPLAAYYAVTLAVPLANGAARSDAFLGHALLVLLVPLIVVMLASVVRALSSLVRVDWKSMVQQPWHSGRRARPSSRTSPAEAR